MSLDDYKHKHSKAIKKEHNKAIHLTNLVSNKPSKQVREDFFRPAYGKIGERRYEYGEEENRS